MPDTSKKERLNDVKIYKSMTDHPRPFFGAGGQALGIFMALFYFGSTFAGLFSIGNLVCLIVGVLQTWVFKEARKFDMFFPEALTAGVLVPSHLRKGYNFDEKSAIPYGSFM